LIEGELNKDDVIYNKNYEIGKVLLHNKYPFALIKYLDDNFNQKNELQTKNAKFKIRIPSWLN